MSMSNLKLTVMLRVLSAVFIIGCGLPLDGVGSLTLRYTPGLTYKYLYNTSTALNQLNGSNDVGFQLSAVVLVTPVWSNNDDTIVVKLQVSKAQLVSLARDHLSRDLNQLSRLPVYFQWQHGRITHLLTSDDETLLSLNIKRGIISIFQFSFQDGIQSEIDVSGNCRVVYQRTSNNSVKKTKTSCSALEPSQLLHFSNDIVGIKTTFSSETDYVITSDLIVSVSTQESFLSQLNIEPSVSPAVYSRQELKFEESSQSESVIQAATLDILMKKLGKDRKGRFYVAVLPATFEQHQQSCTSGCLVAAEMVSKHRAYLADKSTGTVDAVKTFLILIKTFRNSSKEDMLAVLNDKKNVDIILPLIDVITATQTVASQSALMQFIDFNNEDNIEQAERYLLAAALSSQPTASTVTDLLKLFDQDVPSDKLRESIGESLGAVVNTYRKITNDQQIVSQVELTLLNKLDKCANSEQCQLAIVRSLGNAQLSGTMTKLIQLAMTSQFVRVSESALSALNKLESSLLSASDQLNSAVRTIFHQRGGRGYDTSIRSQALRILLSLSTLSVDDVRDIMTSSLDPWNTDYDMYIQSYLFDSAKHNENIRNALKEILRNSTLSNYHVLAPKGKSLAFTSQLAGTSSLTASYHMFVENGRSGIMKRSGMDVNVANSHGTLPVYSFQLYAAGLENLLGEEVDENEKDVEVTAGLGLDLLSVSLRPVSFFTGQAGLMSAIWNAPSELTPALQTSFLLEDVVHHIHLQNGLIVGLDVYTAVSISLEGSLSVSLWNKNAQSLIKNRGSVAQSAQLSLKTSLFAANVEWSSHVESFIDFSSDVNFYDGVTSHDLSTDESPRFIIQDVCCKD